MYVIYKICGSEETANAVGICDDCKFCILDNKNYPSNFKSVKRRMRMKLFLLNPQTFNLARANVIKMFTFPTKVTENQPRGILLSPQVLLRYESIGCTSRSDRFSLVHQF